MPVLRYSRINNDTFIVILLQNIVQSVYHSIDDITVLQEEFRIYFISFVHHNLNQSLWTETLITTRKKCNNYNAKTSNYEESSTHHLASCRLFHPRPSSVRIFWDRVTVEERKTGSRGSKIRIIDKGWPLALHLAGLDAKRVLLPQQIYPHAQYSPQPLQTLLLIR